MNKLRDMKEFKGTRGVYEIVEHNWSETSICSNGKTICSFELDDIEEEDLTENDLIEEENAYNIQLIKHSKEMLEMLKESTEVIKWYMENSTSELSEPFFNIGANQIEQNEKLIKQATEL